MPTSCSPSIENTPPAGSPTVDAEDQELKPYQDWEFLTQGTTRETIFTHPNGAAVEILRPSDTRLPEINVSPEYFEFLEEARNASTGLPENQGWQSWIRTDPEPNGQEILVLDHMPDARRYDWNNNATTWIMPESAHRTVIDFGGILGEALRRFQQDGGRDTYAREYGFSAVSPREQASVLLVNSVFTEICQGQFNTDPNRLALFPNGELGPYQEAFCNGVGMAATYSFLGKTYDEYEAYASVHAVVTGVTSVNLPVVTQNVYSRLGATLKID